jgi:hypothetical protein
MKLHASKRWYLHLLYYEVLKFTRFFTNRILGKRKHKFLFILSPPYCGSTLLNEILSTSGNLSCNNHLGVREGQLLPEVKDIMFNNKGWHSEVNYPWKKIKKIWMKYWDQRKLILMDKTNTNIMRVSEIKKVFDNIYFLGMVRNPYAQVEGIIRRNNATPEYAAQFALKCLMYQKKNKEFEINSLFITYEELCDNKEKVVNEIKSFLPELGDIDSDLEFSAHNFKTDGKMKIQNLNDEKIKKLSPNQLALINFYFNKEVELLNYFGYSIIN